MEILDAFKELAEEISAGRLTIEEIDTQKIGAHLYTRNHPDPDLLIRTSGEMRLSNFLLWQLSYTEIHVTETLWPDFGRADLQKAIADYNQRQRRFGGL